MSRTVQITVDAHDPRSLSAFWREALGYVHPAPPGVQVPEGADVMAAWEDFLEQQGVPRDQWNTSSAVEDSDGDGPRVFFQRSPRTRSPRTASTSTSGQHRVCRVRSV